MPGARGSTTVRGEGAYIANLNQVLRALRSLPKDLQAELRDAAGDISEALATLSQRAASTPLEVAVGRSIRARRDRIPKVVVGGARPVIGSRGAPPGAAMYGALFGGRGRPTTQQFRPHLGPNRLPALSAAAHLRSSYGRVVAGRSRRGPPQS